MNLDEREVEAEARRDWEVNRRAFRAEYGDDGLGPWRDVRDKVRSERLRVAKANLRRRKRELMAVARKLCGRCQTGPPHLRDADGWWHRYGSGRWDICRCRAWAIHEALNRRTR